MTVIETTVQWRRGWPTEHCADGGEHYWRYEFGTYSCTGCPAMLGEAAAQQWQRLREYARYRSGLAAN